MIRLLLVLLSAFHAIAAPAIVQSAKAQPGGTGTAVNFSPSATVVGNVLVACIQNSEFGSNRTVSAPDGTWTNFRDTTQNNVQMTVWWKHVTGSASAYNFSVSGTGEWHSGVLWEVSGVSTSAPINASASDSFGSPGQTAMTTTNATPTVLGTLALACVATDGAQALLSVSGGWTISQEARPSFHGTYGASRDALTSDTVTAINNTFTVTSAEIHVRATILLEPSAAISRRKIRVIQ